MTLAAEPTTAATKSSRFVIREALEADIPAIFALYRRTEPEHKISLQEYEIWWRWLFLMNPAGRGLALGGFLEDGGCVGHVGVTPFDYRIAGVGVKAGFPCKLMVAETHRKSLLYPSLVKRLLQLYPKHGMSLCVAPITRPRVLQANLSLGFRKSASLRVVARPLKAVPLARESLPLAVKPVAAIAAILDFALRPAWGLGTAKSVKVRDARSFEEFDRFLQKSDAARPAIAPRRTPDMLKWRFASQLGRGYRVLVAVQSEEIVGYAAVRPMPMQAFTALGIVDIDWLAAAPEAAKAMLAAIHRMALEQKVDLISALVAPTGRQASALKRAFYLRTPATFTWVFHGKPPVEIDLSARRPEDWAEGWLAHDYV